MAVFFVLLLLIVQIGFGVAARSMVAASVDSTARRLAWSTATVDAEIDRLRDELEVAIPGAVLVSTDVAVTDRSVTVSVVYGWTPPGPDLLPIEVAVERTRLRTVPP